MIPSRDIIAVTRQLGSMTEAGVDILRAIRVLRAQTEDAEWLALYDRLVHDLRLGSGLAEAMSRAPEVFSPFAISLVRQGEARGDLAGSFYRIADYLQKEQEIETAATTPAPALIAPSAPLPSAQECPLWLRRWASKGAVALSIFCGALLLLELCVVAQLVPARWHLTAAVALAFAFCVVVAWRLRQPVAAAADISEAPSQQEPKSTFEESGPAPDEATFE